MFLWWLYDCCCVCCGYWVDFILKMCMVYGIYTIIFSIYVPRCIWSHLWSHRNTGHIHFKVFCFVGLIVWLCVCDCFVCWCCFAENKFNIYTLQSKQLFNVLPCILGFGVFKKLVVVWCITIRLQIVEEVEEVDEEEEDEDKQQVEGTDE